MQDYTQDPSTQQPDPVIGTPEQDTATWDGQQGYPDTCAIRSQEFILEQFTGQEIDETALVQEAESMGWYAPGLGTSPQDMGNLLELHGVPVNHYENANAFQLANELAQGHKVMIGVDSGELVNNSLGERINDLAGLDGADHAVVVSGIDTTDPNNPQVIISDPGTGEPAAYYPMDQFVGAWEDGNFQMVATQNPAPDSVPGMQNFDYAAGHIPSVAGMPYEDFAAYENDPAAFDAVLDPASVPVEQTGWDEDPGAWTEEPGIEQDGWGDELAPGSNTGSASSEDAGGWSGEGDAFSEQAAPDPNYTPQDTDQLLEDVDDLLENSEALLDDLQDGHLDAYGQ